ncbi:hypothetical protein BU17DRAFT_87483 [Hysterangium stoloniferum]|nr:hypothetical protein BU17DRAFT_87483 [Hysterangium stoloniferum]
MSLARCECDSFIPYKPYKKAICPECQKPRRFRAQVAGKKKRATQPPKLRTADQIQHDEELVKGTHTLSGPRRGLQEQYSELYARELTLKKAIAALRQSIAADPPRSENYSTTLQASVPPEASPQEANDVETDLLADAFGVLSLREAGNVQFHGSTAASEYILKECDQITKKAEEKPHPPRPERAMPRLDIFPELVLLNLQFPCPPPQPPVDMTRFLHHLPSYQRASTLLKNYLSHFSWLALPVPLFDLRDILDLLYPGGRIADTLDIAHAHRLGILLGVFLLGTHYDLALDIRSRSRDIAFYLALSRASLTCVSIPECPTLAAIQAMVLMVWYYRLSPATRRDARDSTQYIQDPTGITRGEQTFWEYHAQDIWQSYMFGRPVSITNTSIHCQFPSNVEVHPGHHPKFPRWKFSFASLVSGVVEATGTPDVSYGSILNYDRRLREHPIPQGLEWPLPHPSLVASEAAGQTFQRCLTAVWSEVSLLYMHRPYFWQAVSTPDVVLVRHQYWRSLVAAYHSACAIVSHVRSLWLLYPRLMERMGPFWSHAHSACLVLGALVSLRPDSQFTDGALMHFDETCDMFLKAEDSLDYLSARKSAMVKLQKRAHEAVTNHRASPKVEEATETDGLSDMRLASFWEEISAGSCFDAPSPSLPHRSPGDEDKEKGASETGMPAGYQVSRLLETGWDHLISHGG